MGGDTGGPAGPDLAAGIGRDELADGAMIVGHVEGDAVLLARRGDAYFAVGATCTHYGGPLVEGLFEGETVRCPWHHACFDLRTGEALQAPALNPLPCWRVHADGGHVYVAGKRERDPLAPAGRRRGVGRGVAMPNGIVIVGAGAAGSAAAEMLRREEYDGRITVLDAETDSPYDRPNLSKDYLAGNAPEEWIPLRPPGFHADHAIDLFHGTTVTALDPGARTVTLDDGTALAFDRLLLAPGATPVRLPIPGADQPHVFTLRSLADSRAIIARLDGATHAVVIGASFIGLEVAASLIARGLEVRVVAPETRLFGHVLGVALGDVVHALHEEKGVIFHLGHAVKTIGPREVTLPTGERLPADLVVIGAGVKPRLDLAERAGLTIDRGIVVDEHLETSAPGIFAAGDVARFPDPRSGERVRIEHWVHAERMGQTAARNMLGAGERFTQVPFFWSHHYDLTVNYVGHAERWDEAEIEGDLAARAGIVRYKRDGAVLAVATMNRDRASLEAERDLGATA